MAPSTPEETNLTPKTAATRDGTPAPDIEDTVADLAAPDIENNVQDNDKPPVNGEADPNIRAPDNPLNSNTQANEKNTNNKQARQSVERLEGNPGGDAITTLDFADVFIDINDPTQLAISEFWAEDGGHMDTKAAVEEWHGIRVREFGPKHRRQVACLLMVFETLDLCNVMIGWKKERVPEPLPASFLIITSTDDLAIELERIIGQIFDDGSLFDFRGLMLDNHEYKKSPRFKAMLSEVQRIKESGLTGRHLMVASAGFAASRPWAYHTTIIAYDVVLTHSPQTFDIADLADWNRFVFISRIGFSVKDSKPAKVFTLLDPEAKDPEERNLVAKICMEYKAVRQLDKIPGFMRQMCAESMYGILRAYFHPEDERYRHLQLTQAEGLQRPGGVQRPGGYSFLTF